MDDTTPNQVTGEQRTRSGAVSQFGAARGYVLRVPAEYVESFEAILDLACEAAESTGTAEMWNDIERETVKAIQERKWVAGHNVAVSDKAAPGGTP